MTSVFQWVKPCQHVTGTQYHDAICSNVVFSTEIMVPFKRMKSLQNSYMLKRILYLWSFLINGFFHIQSTRDISKSKGPSETLQDIRTSSYQICRIEENTNRTTICHK